MFTSDAEIHEIATRLIDCTLPKPGWTHAAHFAAAVWLLQSPDYVAERDMPDMIRRYNLACGVENTENSGYHETITLASIRVAKHVISALPQTTPLFAATNTVLSSRYGRSDWILDYWSKARLFSPRARHSWLDPDIKNLPDAE